jgi:hypothetical protein
VSDGEVLAGPDHSVTVAQTINITRFKDDYVSTISALMATYPFISNATTEELTQAQNPLLLDLNSGLDFLNNPADPNAFADRVGNAVAIFGTNGGDTPVRVVRRVGPESGGDVHHHQEGLLAHAAAPGEV